MEKLLMVCFQIREKSRLTVYSGEVNMNQGNAQPRRWFEDKQVPKHSWLLKNLNLLFHLIKNETKEWTEQNEPYKRIAKVSSPYI